MLEHCCVRPAAFLVVLLLAAGASISVAQAVSFPIRAACQAGRPPFTDAKNRNLSSGACEGLFAELFETAMTRMNQPFTVEVVDTEMVDELVRPNATNQSAFDAVIAFHTVTPQRVRDIDMSLSMYQTGYRVALLPKYHSSPGSLADSVLRDAVWYLFGILSIAAFVLALVFLVAENFHPDSELAQFPRWRRAIGAVEAGFETMMAGATTIPMNSQASRTARSLGTLFELFVVNIFAAIVTAQLTSNAADNEHATVETARGLRVAHALPSLQTYLSADVGATPVEVRDIETFADAFYNGLPEAEGFEGFIAESDVVVNLHNFHGGAANGFTVSEIFLWHGSVDLKAFPVSPLLPAAFLDQFNIRLQELRDDGEFAALEAKWVQPFSWPAYDDITVPTAAFSGIMGVAIALYAAMIIACIVLFVHDRMTRTKEPKTSEDAVVTPGAFSPAESNANAVLEWKGTALASLPAELAGVCELIDRTVGANGKQAS